MALDPSTFAERFNQPMSTAAADVDRRTGRSPRTLKELAYKAYIVAQEAEYQGETGIIIEAWLPETLATDVNAAYEAPYAQGLNQMSPNLGAMARFLGVNLTTQALTAQIWQGGGFIDMSIPFIFQVDSSAAEDVLEPLKKLYTLTMPKDPSGGGLLRAPGPRIDIDRLLERTGDTVKDLGTGLLGLLSDGGSSGLDFAKSLAGLNDSTSSVNSNRTGFAKKAIDRADEAARTVSKAIVNSVTNNISLYLGQFLYFPSVVITDVNPTFDVVLTNDMNPGRLTVNVNFRTFYTPTDRDIEIMFPRTASRRRNAQNQG